MRESSCNPVCYNGFFFSELIVMSCVLFPMLSHMVKSTLLPDTIGLALLSLDWLRHGCGPPNLPRALVHRITRHISVITAVTQGGP